MCHTLSVKSWIVSHPISQVMHCHFLSVKSWIVSYSISQIMWIVLSYQSIHAYFIQHIMSISISQTSFLFGHLKSNFSYANSHLHSKLKSVLIFCGEEDIWFEAVLINITSNSPCHKSHKCIQSDISTYLQVCINSGSLATPSNVRLYIRIYKLICALRWKYYFFHFSYLFCQRMLITRIQFYKKVQGA